jgi:hypothetical protein
MLQIPYFFDMPPPKYFRENGWFKNINMMIFIHWAFARCSQNKRQIYHINQIVDLDPYEFIFGRSTCSLETGLTENEVRGCTHQLTHHRNYEILKKVTGKSTSKFTVYKWSTELFCKNNHQQNNPSSTSKSPASHHNQDQEIHRSKVNHHQASSFSKPDDDDDLSSKVKEKIETFEIPKIEVVPGVFLTQAELDTCVASRSGSLDAVIDIIKQIQSWDKRKHDIQDWPSTIKSWTYSKKQANKSYQENVELAKKIVELYRGGKFWTCDTVRNNRKDTTGLLFKSLLPEVKDGKTFFDYRDPLFAENVHKFIMEKSLDKLCEKS